MAIIPNGVEDLYYTIVSYMITLLTILFFVKIFMIFTSLKGSGGGSGSGGSTSNTIKDPKDLDKNTIPSKKEEFEAAKDNPAQFQIEVRNADDKGIKNANVELVPSRSKSLFKKRGRYGRHFRDFTNADGIVPANGQPFNVPSVPYKVTITYDLKPEEEYKMDPNAPKGHHISSVKYKPAKQGRKLRKNKNGHLIVEGEIEPSPGENPPFSFTLPLRGEYAQGFEPFIKKADFGSNSKNEPILKTIGIIKRL